MGLVRRIKARDGIVLVALTSASKEQITQALERIWATKLDSEMNQQKNKSSMARRVPLIPDKPHYSENPHFGLSYEYAATEATYEEAEIPSPAGERVVPKIPSKPIESYQQSLIERQKKTGQGFRNSKRAYRRCKERERRGFDFLGIADDPEAQKEIRRQRAIARAEEERELLDVCCMD